MHLSPQPGQQMPIGLVVGNGQGHLGIRMFSFDGLYSCSTCYFWLLQSMATGSLSSVVEMEMPEETNGEIARSQMALGMNILTVL